MQHDEPGQDNLGWASQWASMASGSVRENMAAEQIDLWSRPDGLTLSRFSEDSNLSTSGTRLTPRYFTTEASPGAPTSSRA